MVSSSGWAIIKSARGRPCCCCEGEWASNADGGNVEEAGGGAGILFRDTGIPCFR
jgi:hypothetical protein